MAEFTLNTPTAVAVGSAIPYNNTIIRGCCNIRHRAGSGIVNVKGGSCCSPNVYIVYFHGNVTGVTGAISLGIYLDGELLPETVMSVVPISDADVLSVDVVTEIPVYSDADSISVRVITGDTVTVNTASLIVKKEGY